MAGVAIVYVGLVMTASRTQGTRPAGVAIVLGIDVAAAQEVRLLLAIDAGRYVSDRVHVGIDEAMARRDIARGSDAQQSERRAAGVRLVDALTQLRQRVAHVRKSVQLAANREFQVLRGE